MLLLNPMKSMSQVSTTLERNRTAVYIKRSIYVEKGKKIEKTAPSHMSCIYFLNKRP